MKLVVVLSLALLLYATPVYMFDTQVLPELLSLQDIYVNADSISGQVVTAR